MPESEHKPHEVIASYRRRRERLVPMVLGGLAMLLLAGGVVLIVLWLTGANPPSLPGFLATETPTVTVTPVPPTATWTPEPTPTIAETPTPPGPTTYVVQLGDNLWNIATEFNVDINLLMEINGITNPNNILVGQTLTIPAPGTERPTPTPLPTDIRPGTRIEYIVQLGDTLTSIAERFYSTAEAIAQASGIKVTDRIGPGQRLTVPVNIATPTRTSSPNPLTLTATVMP